jgi:hypothetical protein
LLSVNFFLETCAGVAAPLFLAHTRRASFPGSSLNQFQTLSLYIADRQ